MFFDSIRASNNKKEFERGFSYVCVELLLHNLSARHIESNLHNDGSEFERGAKKALNEITKLQKPNDVDEKQYKKFESYIDRYLKTHELKINLT